MSHSERHTTESQHNLLLKATLSAADVRFVVNKPFTVVSEQLETTVQSVQRFLFESAEADALFTSPCAVSQQVVKHSSRIFWLVAVHLTVISPIL